MLDSGEVDIVYISATNEAHLILPASLLKLAWWSSRKPLTLFPQDRAADRWRGRATCCWWKRWDGLPPSFLKVRDEIDSGTIGTVEFIRADFGFRIPFANRSRLFDPAQGGGCIYDLGPIRCC